MINSEVIPSLPSGYSIEQSLRFNDDDSAYLSRTPSVAGNRKTWTFSTWVKRGNLGTTQSIFMAGNNTQDTYCGYFDTLDNITIGHYAGGWNFSVTTNMLFRDTSSWYNFVLVLDTTQAIASDRVKIYVNGLEVTSFSTANYPAQNSEFSINSSAYEHEIGRQSVGTLHDFDGYLAETHFIDGQALTPDSFGEFDATYGHWKPKKYEGTYGTNGFYQKYSNGANIGEDSSGNGNHFTATNLSATDIVLDSPTNNFATLNPLKKDSNSTLSEGSLKIVGSSSTAFSTQTQSTFSQSSGKVYYEACYVATTSTLEAIGFARQSDNATVNPTVTGGLVYRPAYGDYYDLAGVNYTGKPTTAVGGIVQFAIDYGAGKVWFGSNGTWFDSGNPLTGLNPSLTFTGTEELSVSVRALASTFVLNFGQDSSFAGNRTPQGYTDANGIGDFYYEPPAGYLALCTANLPEPTVVPSEHFAIRTYTGDAQAGRSETDVGLAPDLLWGKTRSNVNNHILVDNVRGATKFIKSNLTDAEVDNGSVVTSLDADGFTVGTSVLNYLNETEVAWLWKAGGTPAVNNDGTIQSLVSANVDAGFSIGTYTGTAIPTDTVGHGLLQPPELVIYKSRLLARGWFVYTNIIDGSNDYLLLNQTDAKSDWTYAGSSVTSTTIPLDQYDTINGVSDYVFYAFHSVEGYSKIGSYVGNGSADGTFVYCGFRPKYVMVKAAIGGTGHWTISDSERLEDYYLGANLANAENTAYGWIDYKSNGFKLTHNDSQWNGASVTYIFMAFAEHPFKYSNAK